MEHLFRSYLELLQSILSNLSQLTKLVHRKIEVAQMDDLEALDEILNEEQALALAFRGLEQKRLNLLRELDLSEVPLAQLSAHFPPEMEEAVRQTAAELMEQYRTYHNGAQTARGILEHNLREVDRVLAVLNADPAGNPGHVTQTPSSPSAKADFRV
ncbi:flagellar export chaperone FlgN [Dysosmobacter welbionis]|uniref:flagellar export chaperone FlgN n=1 Tax=Dysosmobacter welbionis TaxID=2093857 RepID=UPI003A117E98